MLKKILISLALVSFFPRMLYVLVRCYLFTLITGKDNAFLDATDLMRGWRGLVGMLARRKMLSLFLGQNFGNHATVYNVLFSKRSVRIADNVYIGFNCNIGDVDIGKEVLISDGVTIMSGGRQHGTITKDKSFHSQQGEYIKVTIGDGAWIGADSTIMADVGKGAIVGAGSVVTRPVADYKVVAGVPAKPINTQSHL